MKVLSFWLMTLVFLIANSTGIFAQRGNVVSNGINYIQGRVTDDHSNGVYNAYVELYDNYGALVNKQRTTGQGQYSFRGMGPGRYTVSVKPFGTNLKEDTQEVEVVNEASHSDLVTADFRLQRDKRFDAETTGLVGTIFAQEIPAEAKKLYKSGIDKFHDKPDAAITDLEAAVKIYPQYFDALTALGKANIVNGKYDKGYPYLLQAIDINRRCADCYYSLALAFYRLNEAAAATKAIDAAALLSPQLPSVHLLQGIIYRTGNNLAGAEKALLQAKTLTDGKNPEVFWQLSLVYNRLNRNKEAADALEIYLKIKPEMAAAEKESVRQIITKLRAKAT